MKCSIITIGDEILIGQILDTNSSWMAAQLNLLGIDVVEMRSVSDELDQMVAVLKEALLQSDLVLVTGGLGPTKDDITKSAICKLYGVGLTFSETTRDHITAIYAKFGRAFTTAHEPQCYMPDNAILLHNSMGTAPGMLIEDERGMLVSMPGVPYEMKAIFTEELLPRLNERKSELFIQHSTIMTVGEGETVIADKIEPLLTEMPSFIKLAYLPSLGSVRLRLTGKHAHKKQLEEALKHYTEIMARELGDLAYGYNDLSLEAHLLALLAEKGLWLGTAESCTGGYLAHRLTSVAGSSSYFKGGYIPYSNECKTKWLGVAEALFVNHGAVSQEVVEAMVTGLLEKMGCDVGVAISGIAGPGGGTPEKPVGTIWIAVGNADQKVSRLIKASKDRSKNIEYAAVVAMNMIRRFVLKYYA